MIAEIKRVDQHGKWLAFLADPEKSGAEPAPGWKDCDNCPQWKQSRQMERTIEQRRAMCQECPYEDCGPPPSARFYLAQGLDDYPTEAIGREVDAMTVRELKDLAAYRRWRESKRGW